MLTLYHSRAGRGERPANLAEESLPENAAWIDLLRPQPDEVAFVKRTTGLDVPSIADLSEIESSSRLRNQNGAIYLSAPLVYHADSDQPLTTPVGFVLTRERLITVRFEELNSFTTFANRDLAAESDPLSSAAVFAGLMDAIADRLADILENIAAELDALSHRLFRTPATQPAARRPPAHESADLRIILRRVGHSGDLASKIRDSLLGIGRMCLMRRASPPIGCRQKLSRNLIRCARTCCRSAITMHTSSTRSSCCSTPPLVSSMSSRTISSRC